MLLPDFKMLVGGLFCTQGSSSASSSWSGGLTGVCELKAVSFATITTWKPCCCCFHRAFFSLWRSLRLTRAPLRRRWTKQRPPSPMPCTMYYILELAAITWFTWWTSQMKFLITNNLPLRRPKPQAWRPKAVYLYYYVPIVCIMVHIFRAFISVMVS